MDTQHSIEKLEGQIWPEHEFETELVKRCHDLRKMPLDKLSIEDLRLLIGQQVGLQFILDIAISRLSQDILSEGDLYPGDLLQSLLNVDPKYWADNAKHWTAIDELLLKNLDIIDDNNIKTEIFYSHKT